MGNFLSWLQAFASSKMNPLLCLLLTSAQSPNALLQEALPPNCGRKVGKISPGKNMILPCTTAAFTISHVLQTGFVMLCSLTQGFGLICDFCSSARRFALWPFLPRWHQNHTKYNIFFFIDIWRLLFLSFTSLFCMSSFDKFDQACNEAAKLF